MGLNARAWTRHKYFPTGLGILVILGGTVLYSWPTHKEHILGALPYLLLLMCPLMHLFMHRGHGHGNQEQEHTHNDRDNSYSQGKTRSESEREKP